MILYYTQLVLNCGRMGSTLINGATEKVTNFDRLRKKVRPGASGEIKVGEVDCPKSPSDKKNNEICSDPVSVDPICPSPMNADPVGVGGGCFDRLR